MDEFLVYFQIGLQHVLNIQAYDHVLFIIAMVVPYSHREWSRILVLVSLFTLGHSVALILSVFGVISFKEDAIEFLIPVTIFATAFMNFFSAGKTAKNDKLNIVYFTTLFFGLIHGLGFSTYFKTILGGSSNSKLFPLASFAVGIEAAQIVVVAIVLFLGYLIQSIFGFSKRDWILTSSAFVIGVVIPMILQHLA